MTSEGSPAPARSRPREPRALRRRKPALAGRPPRGKSTTAAAPQPNRLFLQLRRPRDHRFGAGVHDHSQRRIIPIGEKEERLSASAPPHSGQRQVPNQMAQSANLGGVERRHNGGRVSFTAAPSVSQTALTTRSASAFVIADTAGWSGSGGRTASRGNRSGPCGARAR